MKIILLHYRYVPAAAGVELIMEQHARLLADAGHEVTVIAGSGSSRDSRVQVVLIPELMPTHPLREAAQQEFDQGNQSPFPPPLSARPPSSLPYFDALSADVETALRPWMERADRVFVHNVLTMPFHLACTAALWRLADTLPAGRIINWVHDLAAVNPDYHLPETQTPKIPRSSAPWALLGLRHPAMRAVAISAHRAGQFLALTGTAVDAVIPNGIDPLGLLNLSPAVARFAAEHHLLDADVLLFQPARILRRKNIELGLHLLAILKERGCRARLLITGAPDEHNAASPQYHAELLRLREALGLQLDALFVSESFPVAKADLASLYGLSDILWFPSKQEGFGLPLIEGALHRLLLFCADRPPMNTFALPNTALFDPAGEPRVIADQFLQFLEKNSPFLEARRAVIRRFAWKTIWPQIQALLTPESS